MGWGKGVVVLVQIHAFISLGGGIGIDMGMVGATGYKQQGGVRYMLLCVCVGWGVGVWDWVCGIGFGHEQGQTNVGNWKPRQALLQTSRIRSSPWLAHS